MAKTADFWTPASKRVFVDAMTSVWDRRTPRITYQVPVGVYDVGREQALSVSSINVSQGGMFVDTTESLAIGTELICNLPVGIGNDALQVRGRVAWLREQRNSDAHRPVGMGIEFVDLSDEESGQLSEIVGAKKETSYPVRMQLTGMGGAIRACAKLTDQGIFIRAPLPFLSQDSRVDFSFIDNEDESHRGRIIGVEIHHDEDTNVPRLQVEIELDSIGHDELQVPDALAQVEKSAGLSAISGHAAVEGPQYVGPEDTVKTTSVFEANLAETNLSDDDEWSNSSPSTESPIAESSETPILSEKVDAEEWNAGSIELPSDDEDEDDDEYSDWHDDEYGETPSGERRPLWPLMAAIVFVVGGALAFGLYGEGDDAKAAIVETRGQSDEVLALLEGVEFEPVEAIATGPIEEKNQVSEHGKVAPVIEEKVAEPAQSQEKVPTKSEEKTPRAADSTRTLSAKNTSETIHGLKITDGEELVFRLPLRGTDERFNSYRLADPPGIAVNLPYAKPKSGFIDSVSPKHPQVRRAWMRERLGGLHFRLFFTDASQDCKASVKKETLVIRCSKG
ncbi:MAG: PilZ domain-containing protein [Kofleriaceae bacterium]|nr:PilZ domain-containing protein [Kofleriaceae bacterium]